MNLLIADSCSWQVPGQRQFAQRDWARFIPNLSGGWLRSPIKSPGKSAAGRQNFVDRHFFQGHVFGQSSVHGDFDFSFNQWAGVGDKLFVGQESVVGDPIAGDKMASGGPSSGRS